MKQNSSNNKSNERENILENYKRMLEISDD